MMFGFFSQRLTEYSNHYVDWSRVGELLKSGTHRYSADELVARGKIITWIAVSAFLGAQLNNPTKSHCTDLTATLAMGCLGFIAGHTVAIFPLMKKRYQMSQDCKQLVKDICSKMQAVNPPLCPVHARKVEELIKRIQHMSLSDEKHGRASQTWGNRKNLLTRVKDSFHQDESGKMTYNKDEINLIIKEINVIIEDRKEIVMRRLKEVERKSYRP